MPDSAAFILKFILLFSTICSIIINIISKRNKVLYIQQTITAKLQILVDPSNLQLLCDTMKSYSDACNYVSEYIYKTHDLRRYRVQENTYYPVRENYGLRSQMAVSCVRTVVAKYKTILENQKEWIKPVFRHPQIDLVWNRDYSLDSKSSMFSINTLHGRIRVPFYKNGFEQYFNEGCKYGTARLVNKHGRFFLHMPVTYEVSEVQRTDISNVTGIDRGIRFLAASYDSSGKTVFYEGKTVKQKRAHYKTRRKQLQQVGTPSSRKRLKAIGHRENRWMNDVNHCISKALVESNPEGTLFVIEDLRNIRAATERVRVKDRYVSVSWAYNDLEQKLSYKAQRHHQLVTKVNPAYTSQTCPKCGHTEKANRNKKRHHFCCKNCGYQSNDDRIAAMNLHRKGINILVPDAATVE